MLKKGGETNAQEEGKEKEEVINIAAFSGYLVKLATSFFLPSKITRRP